MNTDKYKYIKMETVLQRINKVFITVNNEDAQKANSVLKHVINETAGAMEKKSPLFKVLFTDIFYGGSYFEGLKISKPEEFDIDLRLSLPMEVTLEISDKPGFVRVQLNGWDNFAKDKRKYKKYRGLERFKDAENYLLVNKVLQWVESIITRSLNTFPQSGKKYLIPYNGKSVEVTLKKKPGPAVTLLITYGEIFMNVDLAAVFKFSQNKWPSKPFKSLPKNKPKKQFMVVPESPRGNFDCKDTCWRLSLQEQEKDLISGLNNCKTTLRIIKKLRDTQNHKSISSYMIKTVFFHEIDKQEPEFWNTSLSCVLMHMLKRYKTYLEEYTIPDYWDTRNNLLQHINKRTIDHFKNNVECIIKSVNKNIEKNPLIIADYLLSGPEVDLFKQIMSSRQEPEYRTQHIL